MNGRRWFHATWPTKSGSKAPQIQKVTLKGSSTVIPMILLKVAIDILVSILF